jgi:hypothetical protein
MTPPLQEEQGASNSRIMTGGTTRSLRTPFLYCDRRTVQNY